MNQDAWNAAGRDQAHYRRRITVPQRWARSWHLFKRYNEGICQIFPAAIFTPLQEAICGDRSRNRRNQIMKMLLASKHPNRVLMPFAATLHTFNSWPRCESSSLAGDLKDSIRDNAQGPAKAAGDAGSVEQHKLSDQIEADKYLASKEAAKTKRRGLQFNKLVPPGVS
jgi:hypothetical protein